MEYIRKLKPLIQNLLVKHRTELNISYYVDYLLIGTRFQPAPVGSDNLILVPVSS